MNKPIHHGILITALLAGASLPLYAQPGMAERGYHGTNQWSGQWTNQGGANHHGRHEQWRAMKEELASEIKAQDAELEQLAAQMSNAPPAQKLDAVSAVVGKLVEDRLALHQKLESMHEQMHGTNTDTNTSGFDTNTSSALPETR